MLISSQAFQQYIGLYTENAHAAFYLATKAVTNKLQSMVNLLVALRVDVALFNVFREAVTTQIASWRRLAVGLHFSWAVTVFLLRVVRLGIDHLSIEPKATDLMLHRSGGQRAWLQAITLLVQ